MGMGADWKLRRFQPELHSATVFVCSGKLEVDASWEHGSNVCLVIKHSALEAIPQSKEETEVHGSSISYSVT